ALAARHEMLRARVVTAGGRYRVQVMARPAKPSVSEIAIPAEVDGLGVVDRVRAAAEELAGTLDPLAGRTIAAARLHRRGAPDVLLLVGHRYVMDTQS